MPLGIVVLKMGSDVMGVVAQASMTPVMSRWPGMAGNSAKLIV